MQQMDINTLQNDLDTDSLTSPLKKGGGGRMNCNIILFLIFNIDFFEQFYFILFF